MLAAHAIQCADCHRTFPVVDGIADFVGDPGALPSDADCCDGPVPDDGAPDNGSNATLLTQIKNAVGPRWPASLGALIAVGRGGGTIADAIVTHETFRGMLVLDTDTAMLRACQARVASAASGVAADRSLSFAALPADRDAIRDAVADTVIGTALLARIDDVRALLTMVHRILKPGGRALFVVPNRRHRQAICHAVAEALTQHYAREGSWWDGADAMMNFLAESRRLLVNCGNREVLSPLREKHLFDTDALAQLGREIGFAAEALPLSPDPSGQEAIRRVCLDARIPDDVAQAFASFAACVGRPFFNLLSQQDRSTSMVLWLGKASGPEVRIYTGHAADPATMIAAPDVALACAMPRWSIKLLARDTSEGIVVGVGGWCLSNIDALSVRLTLGGVVRCAPVWRQRPDVHEVMNAKRLYNPLNALCCGLDSQILFDDVHPEHAQCTLLLEIVLAGDLVIVTGAPEILVMDEQMVVAH